MRSPFARPLPARRLAACALAIPAITLATPALADCTADSSGLVVTCSGTSAAYGNTASGVAVSAASGGTMTGPLVIGDNGTLVNAGTISGTLTVPVIEFGANAAITNTGTITSTSGTTGAILAGDNSVVVNSGALAAVSGTAAVSLGAKGSFTNSSSATSAITGNIVFAASSGAQVSRFANASTSYGLAGQVIATGNLAIDNAGNWAGALTQGANGGAVSFANQSAGVYSGVITTGDTTTIDNAGTMTFGTGSLIGTAAAGTTRITNTGTMTLGPAITIGTAGSPVAALVNTGTMTVGYTSSPALVTVNGSYAQGAAGTLTVAIRTPAAAATTAGTNYSQLYLTGSGGTASIGGTLALSVAAGFYPTGSVYKVIVADQGITGSFSSITGNSFAFITFVPLGVVTTSGSQQAYEFVVQRTRTYAEALAGVGTANQLAMATGLQGLVATASAAPTGDAAALVGQIDVLTTAQAQAFLNALSPAGYLHYATALRDQANAFTRQVAARLGDFNGEQGQSGWWGSGMSQFQFGGDAATTGKAKLYGLNMGYDVSGPSYVAGLAGTVSWDGLDFNGTMSGHNRALGLTAYGGWRTGPLHLTAQLGYLFGHLAATKVMTLDTTTRTATASSREHLFKANATAGFMLRLAGVAAEPFVGIDFATGRIDGFTETGAGAAANLTVAAIDARRTDLLAGLNLSRSSGKWRPYLRATWRSALGSPGASTVTAWLNEDAATAFTVTGTPQARHELDADAGVNIVFEDAGTIFFAYQGTMRSGYRAHGLNAGIRFQF